MKSIAKRIRRDYAPLTVTAGLVCITPQSPAMQVYDEAAGSYDPDRTVSPTVIHPEVRAGAKDGSWAQPVVNPILASMVWKVNGADISTLSDWTGKYSIDTSTNDSRGDLTIMRNLDPGTMAELTFEAVFPDTRQGYNVSVKTEALRLYTADKAEEYALDMGETQILQYNPFKDALHRYEYKTSHGLLTVSSTAEAAARADVNSYDRTVPLRLMKGDTAVPAADYLIKLHEVTASGVGASEITAGGAGFEEVRAIAPSGITLDLRLAPKRDYLARAFVAGAYQAGDNLFLQSDFGKTDKWYKGGGVTIDDGGYNGHKAMCGTFGSGSYLDLGYQTVSLKAGKTYTLSAYVKGSGNIRLIAANGDNSYTEFADVTLAGTWAQATLTFNIAADGDYLVGFFRLTTSGATGYVSCPKLEEGATATAWSLHRSEILDKEVSRVQFSVNRLYPKFMIRPTNGTSINEGDTVRHDRAMVDCDGNIVEVPESIVRILWYTDSQSATGLCHGEGAKVTFLLGTTGLGSTYADGWLDVYCDAEQKETHCLAVDENGDTLTDENGDELIFN